MRILLAASDSDSEKIEKTAKDFGDVTKVLDNALVVPSIQEAAEEEKPFEVIIISDELEEFPEVLKAIRMTGEGQVCEHDRASVVVLTTTFLERHTKEVLERCEIEIKGFLVKPHVGTSVARLLEEIELESNMRELHKPEFDMKILAVEDHPVSRKQLRLLLRSVAYITTVESAEELFSEIFSIDPDLITMDVQLPGVTGIQACERLRNTPRFSDVPVIFITASDSNDDEIAMFKAGANDFVKKPFGNLALRARIRNQLLRRKAELALQKEAKRLERTVRILDCLFRLSELVMDTKASTEKLVRGIVDVVPTASERPENLCARITLKDQEFKAGDFRETIWKISSPICAYEKPIGSLDVCMLEEDDSSYDGMTSIVNDIAGRISQTIEQRHHVQMLKKMTITDKSD